MTLSIRFLLNYVESPEKGWKLLEEIFKRILDPKRKTTWSYGNLAGDEIRKPIKSCFEKGEPFYETSTTASCVRMRRRKSLQNKD